MAKQIYFWELFHRRLTENESPNRLAAGVALGVLIGLVPKEMILVPILIVVIILGPVSLLTGFLSSGLFFLLSQVEGMREIAVRCGIAIYELFNLATMAEFFLTKPYLPWLQFDSPLTIGWLVIGTPIAMVSFFLSKNWFSRVGKNDLKRPVKNNSDSSGQPKVLGSPLDQRGEDQS